MDSMTMRVNPFPPRYYGLKRVKAVPYLWKERWAEADFGDRWRALKRRQRACVCAPAADAARAGEQVL